MYYYSNQVPMSGSPRPYYTPYSPQPGVTVYFVQPQSVVTSVKPVTMAERKVEPLTGQEDVASVEKVVLCVLKNFATNVGAKLDEARKVGGEFGKAQLDAIVAEIERRLTNKL